MENETNLNGRDSISAKSYYPASVVYFQIIAYTISTFLCVTFNLVNLVTIPRATHHFGGNTVLCIITLSIIDLLTGLICSCTGIFFLLIDVPEPIEIIVNFLCTTFVLQSLLTLTLGSVDRYIAVSRPLRYLQLFSDKRMVIALVTTLSLASVNSGLTFIQGYVTGICRPFSRGCAPLLRPGFAAYNILPFTALLVSIIVNVRLFWIAVGHERQIAVQVAAVRNRGVAPTPPRTVGIRGLKTMLVLTASFYSVWLPVIFTNFVPAIFRIRVSRGWIMAIRYAIICNSWWNAVVYWIMNKSYRAMVNATLRLIFCRRHNRIDPGSETATRDHSNRYQSELTPV